MNEHISIEGVPKGKWVDGCYVLAELDVAELAITGLVDEDVAIMVDKGFIEFRIMSGMVVRVQGRSLGDGIKRLVKFFKDLKKWKNSLYLKEEWEELNRLLTKHGIDLEAL